MMGRAFSLITALPILAGSGLVACGGSDGPRSLVDESNDFVIAEPTSSHLAGTQPVGPDVAGSQWTWTEAHCTEGPLDLASQGFSRVTRVTGDADGLLFVHDDTFGETCRSTTVQHASPGSDADAQWEMTEEASVSAGQCEIPAEATRPGDVRRRGPALEVYVQRSVWCNGLELRMVYVPAEPTSVDDMRLALHYAAHFNRRDAQKLTELFAPTGSLVDPFTRTPLDQAVRYDGQAAVYNWFRETFAATPWLAMKVVDLEPGPTPGLVIMDWHYMDPRLDAPFVGRNRLTVAGGEIFETSIEITAQQVPQAEATPAPRVAAAPTAAAPAAAPAQE